MRRAISSTLTRGARTLGVKSGLFQLTQYRFQWQPLPGVPPQLRVALHDRHQDTNAAPAGSKRSDDAQPEFEPPKKPTGVPKLLRINTNEKGITNVQLARAPVNSMSLELFQELNQWMLWLGNNEETKAVIISSAIPTVFSAGLDLVEVHNPKPDRIAVFWQSFQEMWLIFNSFPKPIIAAITGNSPAGGCIIAMGCDYRVMARGPKDNTNNNRLYRIGLNETKLGLVAPPWVMPAYAYLLGSRQAERMLQLGETPVADDARNLGLIDEVAADEESTIEAAYQQAERFLSVPQQARRVARDMVRCEYLRLLATEDDRNYDTEFFTQYMLRPEVQKNLESYLERLKSRSRK
ncbi:putative 3,2-trans-enoyl-CoA isomerase, mitochondrial precursor [Leishmania infantum JPCM5]|uniref:Enoyl-CoA delta isomerase 1, mitochondrial n=2 Tax=Leishmania infantum TaxID=5671 RepID=A4I738_LEIIN|nr:putative 3,2-trans-enoyl-CoA isomerase, mitochondrial precursor [Leishmania infantum JPCM5]CAC9520690.1 3_-2-trans-enoyl-CoA_isomerase_-_mitochondrial_precursor_-_putative [Leishmania infantum]CAM70617.1 putative 3,2-trans-enoyl-CoA isomerase, mitochondrial precursor [Leishmania infantum JPCM5]SUZ44467.1 3_-2-trans-enoyl-CoA_isomerase_-_mitochondrial_precursor_-_putative [Leishmania infantum]|eukprot:XP_001467557.1 putative 3,2-trans-enoyl-CoA isomerase, mitochondrial precursor [Leishmania infantum JPCM5]